LQLQLSNPPKELDILAVAAGVAAFDIMDAQSVELQGDFNFVLGGQADPFALRAVAQSRIENTK